ncbi:MAG: PIN domain nuclease [Cyanobacteria bacterium SW_8_48_13]|nr:MAG: PIN domain nuclease [Cyanobacteria bacterium SW_8_48_13]
MALTAPWILLYTNVILYLLEGRLTEPLASGQYFVSVITEIELLSYPSLGSYEEMQIRKFLRNTTVVRIENYIKERAIAFRKIYRLKLADAIIKATAKSLDATWFTNDLELTNLTEIRTQSVSIL